jgi:hypothetical protein
VLVNDVTYLASGVPLLDVVSTLLLVGGSIVTLGAAAVVATGVMLYRRVRRSAALETASLRLHLVTEAGPRREVVRLRLQLRRALDGGRTAIGAADTANGLAGETPALFRRIQREAATVDQHLRVLQGEDDRDTLQAALPALRRRVSELTGLVRRLRASVAAGLEAASDSSMAELGADVEREVIALQAGRDRLRNLGRPDEPGRPRREAIR